MMSRNIWLILSAALISHLIQSGEAVRDEHCLTGDVLVPADTGTFPYTTAEAKTDYYTYTGTTCTAETQFQCDNGDCLSEGKICDGTDDCTAGGRREDEVACGTASCATCTADATFTEGEIVSWIPPTGVPSQFELISDKDHFPYTTFRPGVTPVTYRILGPAPFHICRFDITVNGPASPPIASCPNANIIESAGVGEATAMVTWTEPTSITAGVTVAINNEAYRSNSEFPIGYTRVVYTLTDPATGDVSYCAFYVHVIGTPDGVGPSITCIPPVVIIVTPPDTTGSAQEQLDEMLATAEDYTSITTSHDTDHPFPLGTTTFLVTLIDSDGNSHSSCRTDVTVQYPDDDIAPVIANCPSGVTVCHATGATSAQGSWTEPTASDNVQVKSFTTDISPNNFLDIPTTAPFTITVTYTATDWNDNMATCVFDIGFEEDTLPPLLTNCNNYTEYTTQTTGSIVVNYPEPTISDNCDQFQVSVSPDTAKSFAVESIQRLTYTAMDNAGNSASCDFTVEVRIDQLPEFVNCPTSWTVTTDPGTTTTEVSWTAPQVSDDNQVEPDNVKLTISPFPGVLLDALEDQTQTLEKGVYTVVYSYTDVALQTRECPFTITVQDSEAPVFDTCPGDLERTLNSKDETIEVEWDSPTAGDNDGGDVQIQIQNEQYESGEEFRAGEYTIVYIATDQSGNEGFCSFILTVYPYDTSNFWIDCPDDIEVTTDAGRAYASVEWDPPQLRAGVDGPRWSQTHSPGATFVVGETRVEYNVFDSSDNSETCAFTVSVIDNEPPVIISCPGDCTVYGRPGRDSVPVYWPDPRTSDNSGSTVSLSANPFGSGTEFGYGTHQVYYTAVDASGNTVTGCHFQITVVQPGETFVVSGNAEFSSIRGASSTNAVSEAANLADDMDDLFRQNTAISKILAGVQVGTPSPLSGGDLLVPFNLYFAECRAAFLHVRDSLTQNLEGNNRNAFDSNNIILPETFQLNTKEFKMASLTIGSDRRLPTGQQDLIYNGDYNNPRTSAYQNLEDRICDCMDVLYSSFTGYCGCDVWQFRAGSVVTDAILIFADSSAVSQSALSDQLLNSINPADNSLHDLVLENSALTTITEICPEGFCQNGGTCEPNAATYESQCRCPTDYTGTQCQSFSGDTRPSPTSDPGTGTGTGLTTEEIIGIVVGTVGGLLLLIILLACFCVFCLRPTEPIKSQPIIQEPPEPVYAVQQRQQQIMVRDMVVPPPMLRPVPVRVPAPFPVPVRQPVPVPVPRPVPRPVPVPIRQPFAVPVPVRVPVPRAVARPIPVPVPTPVAVPTRVPISVPRPVPVPTPVRIPVNVGVPIREQVPVVQPYGIPTVSRQPFGPGLGGGFGSNLNGFNTGLNSGLGFNNGLNGYNTTGF